MSRPIALIWGALTILPLLRMIYLVGSIALAFGHARFEMSKSNFDSMFRFQVFTVLLILLLIASYITFLFKTERVASDKKALWAVVLFLGHIIAMPIFWYLYVWSEDRGAGAGTRRVD